jgi:hypothetical protein
MLLKIENVIEFNPPTNKPTTHSGLSLGVQFPIRPVGSGSVETNKQTGCQRFAAGRASSADENIAVSHTINVR